MAWDPAVNLSAYQEVEAASNYGSAEELLRYRSLLLDKSRPAADCVRTIVGSGAPFRVLEICAGSSRLLFALEALGAIQQAIGVEVSRSRHDFAEHWKHDLKSDRVQNILSAADRYHFTETGLDVVVMIDGALSYIYPCGDKMPGDILGRAFDALSPGGKVLLEFDVLSAEKTDILRRDGSYRNWYYGHEKDAFRFALYETRVLDWEQMVVENCSIYLPRSGGEDRVKREHYKYYSPDELSVLLSGIGYSTEFFGSFGLTAVGAQSSSLIVVATKPV